MNTQASDFIDPRAVIDPSARLSPGVRVGAYAIIDADVEIGENTHIASHAVIRGPTRIGRDNRIFQFASIGDAPQDKKYGGEPTRLEIGDRNTIREYVTINRGTVQDAGVTRVGNDNWIMAYVHIAHDCQIGNHTIFSNNASLAGHVCVEDFAILSGFTLVHQFCKIGAHCFTGMNSAINMDVPPYVMVAGQMAKPYGLNVEGLKRRGFTPETLQMLRRAYKILYRSKLTLAQAIEQLRPLSGDSTEVAAMVAFLETSKRGIVR